MVYEKGGPQAGSFSEAYQANALSKSFRKRVQDFHGWVEPFCQPFVAFPRLMELLGLLVNDSENGIERVAVLELGGKWMREKIALCAFFVGLQGIIENQLEIGG
jgi:hypothetical protein